MIIAWVLLASIGVLLPRYYKNILSERTLLKKKIWFAVHIFLMSSTCLISIVAFLFVLAALNWKWTELPQSEDSTLLKQFKAVDFSHSIFGIVTIGLALIQVYEDYIHLNNIHFLF